MRSISRSRSRRQLGSITLQAAGPAGARPHPRPVRTLSTAEAVIPSGSTVVPRIRWTSLRARLMGLRFAVRSSIPDTRASTRSPAIDPPLASRMRETSAEAIGAALKSAPRSKRWLASVCSPWRRAVRRTAIGSNQAASTRTFFVSAVIIVSQPPITPARPRGFA